MKSKAITTGTGLHDPELEKNIEKKDTELKERARKNGKHFAKSNPNLPLAVGDILLAYIREIKTGYEQLGAMMFHWLQPQTHFPQGKMDFDFAKGKEKQIDKEIKDKNDENNHAKYELQDFHPGSLPLRILLSLILSFIILAGEVFYNTKAFQVFVDNMLFALGFSIAIATAVLIASHAAAFLYKEAKTKLRRWVISISSLSIVSIVFYVIASIRSSYLSTHDVHINPLYFVVFNLFFFIVIAFLSFFILPTWEDVKEQYRQLALYRAIKKRTQEIKKLEAEKVRMKNEHHLTEKERIQIIYYANYQGERIRKMYAEAVGIFMGTNHIYRTDKQTPECFSQVIPELDIQDIAIPIISQNETAK